MQASLSVLAEKQSNWSSGELMQALQERAVCEVRELVETWRVAAELELERELDSLWRLHWGRTQHICDRLSRQAANLFLLPFVPVAAEAHGRSAIVFRYKLWEIPDSLTLLRRAVMSRLPRRWTGPWIVRAAQRQARDSLDLHAGRIRHALEDRARDAARQMQQELRDVLFATISPVETGVRRAMAARCDENAKTSALQEQLRERVQEIQGVVSSLPYVAP